MTALPDSIIQNGLFCCWKYEERNGRKTKVPYQPETGLGAKSNDPSSFVPYKNRQYRPADMMALELAFSTASVRLTWTTAFRTAAITPRPPQKLWP